MNVEEIYREYGDKIRGYIRSRVNNPEDAEDLHSEVFLKIQSRAEEYEQEKGAVSTWIYTITHNTVIDYYRTHKIMASLDQEEPGELTPPELIAEGEIDTALLNRETLEELAEALKGLSPDEKDIVVYHYYHELTLQDISEKTGLSYGQVKLRHASALKKLKKFFVKKAAGGRFTSYQ